MEVYWNHVVSILDGHLSQKCSLPKLCIRSTASTTDKYVTWMNSLIWLSLALGPEVGVGPQSHEDTVGTTPDKVPGEGRGGGHLRVLQPGVQRH